jgi:hypothetical protein
MDVVKVFCLMLFSCLAANATAQTALANPCFDLKERTEHDARRVDADVDAFDSDRNRIIDAEEYRNYLLACDRGVAGLQGADKREERISERFEEIAQTYGQNPEMKIRQPIPGVPELETAPVGVVQNYANRIDLLHPYKTPPPVVAGPGFTFARPVVDARNPFAKDPAAIAPFLIAYRNDRKANKESGVVLGVIGYGPFEWGEHKQWQSSVAAGFDVDTALDPEKSTISFATEFRYFGMVEGRDGKSYDGYQLLIAPTYQTDGNGDRDVLALKVELGFAGRRFARANQWLQYGAENGAFRRDKTAFRWSPSIKLNCGDVRDDGGNASLAAIRADGSYCRAHHAAQLVWVGAADGKIDWNVRLAYEGMHDFRRNWNRDYAELEFSFARKLSPVRFLVLYRHGRPAPTFDKKDELLVGFGFTK